MASASVLASPKVDLYAPFTSDTLLEVRSGKMKPLHGLTIQSGIDKTVLTGEVRIGRFGIEGDEHDPTFHGGPFKAVHQCKLSVSL
jgi:MOSC domain-containing protein YiiM